MVLTLDLGIQLAWFSTGSPVLSSTNSDTGTGEMSLSGASFLSRTAISPTVGEEGEDEEMKKKNDSSVSLVSVRMMKMSRKNLSSQEPR